jgi:hypothetical protein
LLNPHKYTSKTALCDDVNDIQNTMGSTAWH